MKAIGLVVNNNSANKNEISTLLDFFKHRYKVYNIELKICNDVNTYYGTFYSIDINILYKCDYIVVIGGDGTKNFVANLLIRNNIDIPIIGISNGTMNVGNLSNFSINDILTDKYHKRTSLNGLCINIDSNKYYAFYDIIFSSTFVGTLQNRITQLSAVDIFRNERIEAYPIQVGNANTNIIVNRSNVITSFPSMEYIGIIGLAMLDKGLAAKILAGGADHPATIGIKAGIVISPERYVWPSRSVEEYQKVEPVMSMFASFNKGDSVTIKQLNQGVYPIIDGNALNSSTDSRYMITYEEKVIEILTPATE